MSVPSDQDPVVKNPQQPDADEELQSHNVTMVAEAAVDPLGAHPPGGDLLAATTPGPYDVLDAVAHALDDMSSAYMPCGALDSVGLALEHLITTTNLFDVPPFDIDGSTG